MSKKHVHGRNLTGALLVLKKSKVERGSERQETIEHLDEWIIVIAQGYPTLLRHVIWGNVSFLLQKLMSLANLVESSGKVPENIQTRERSYH